MTIDGVTFGTVSGCTFDIFSGSDGAFPVSGAKFIAQNEYCQNNAQHPIRFDFEAPVSAFGLYITDHEEGSWYDEDVTITIFDGTSTQSFIVNSLPQGGGVTFFGYVSDQASIQSVTLTQELWVGYDDFYYSTVVPIPAAVWLFGSSLGLLGWMHRTKA